MMIATKNRPSIRKCAFCEYWYDPTNSVIEPKKGLKDTWEYKTKIKKACIERNGLLTESQSWCFKFKCKL